MKATDFFGGGADGLDKFKTIALRAMYDQKMEVELANAQIEMSRLKTENTALAQQVKHLTDTMDANIDDRERVLAFKTKRVDELQVKVKDYEAINASLIQSITGSTDTGEAGKNTPASVALLQKGLSLFHPVETCKEQEYKRLWDEKKLQCEHLQRQITQNEALVADMMQFQREKDEYLVQIRELQAQITQVAAEKDEKLHFLERKLVFEHDRLAKEKETEITAHGLDMEKQLRLQLNDTTWRTIEENTRVQLELRYQSTQLERLVKQLDTLQAENRHARHEKGLLEEMNATLSKKIKFYEQLFAKMQQKDQQSIKHQHAEDSGRISPLRRKPPLPSLGLTKTELAASAFALSGSSPRPQSPLSREEESSLELDMSALDLSRLGDQLNSVASDFDAHIHRREFNRKAVHAMVQYHSKTSEPAAPPTNAGGRRVGKHREMRSKREYNPSNYAPRGARRLREAPLTLDTLIHEHASISPRNRVGIQRRSQAGSPSADSILPALAGGVSPQPPAQRTTDPVSLWRSPQDPAADSQPHTARF